MIKTHTLTLLLLMMTLTLSAQKTMYTTIEEVTAVSIAELDELMKDPDFLKILNKEDIHGNYTYEITVKEKGQIASMRFMQKSADASIHGQNFMNNLVKKHKFSFKVPKGNFYKFTYTFKIP